MYIMKYKLTQPIFKFFCLVNFVLIIVMPSFGQIQLSFTGSPTVSGTAGAVNTTYTYSNIGTAPGPITISGVITILSITGSAVLQNIDATSGGSGNAWQPVINGPTTSEGGCWSIEFRLSFFNNANGNPLTLSSFRVSGVDIDGDGSTLREFNEFRYPTNYTVETPTSLNRVNNSGVYTFTSPQTQYTGIVLTQTNVIVTCIYNNRNTMTMRFGACCSGGNCSATGTNRQYSINFFDAVTYANALVVLPVDFINLRGEPLANSNKITWKVAAESNVASYDIERSSDGVSFSSIGNVPFRPGTEPEKEYSFLDPVATGNYFYRIKNIDYDNNSKYSRIIKINRGQSTSGLSLLSNPVQGNFEFEFISVITQQVQLRLMDNAGRIVWRKTINMQKGTNIFRDDGSAKLSTGMYILSLTDAAGNNYQAKLLKN